MKETNFDLFFMIFLSLPALIMTLTSVCSVIFFYFACIKVPMLISAQLFDKDFNEYVDLLEEDPICDMSVVRVVKPPSGAGITKEVCCLTM